METIQRKKGETKDLWFKGLAVEVLEVAGWLDAEVFIERLLIAQVALHCEGSIADTQCILHAGAGYKIGCWVDQLCAFEGLGCPRVLTIGFGAPS